MSQIGNPNQPNFSYIPIRATSASAHLGPGYRNPRAVQPRVAGITSFSQVPRFGPTASTPKSNSARRSPSPTPSPSPKNNRWENEVLHFSRRPCVTNEPREYYETVVEEHSMRSGSPCYVQKKQPKS
jgi:hypothetical protein